jgi:hypothetical protein
MNQNPESSDKNEPEMEDDPVALERIHAYRDELNIVFQKSQDSFEKQLSFISTGTLTLSVGFIKDIVRDFDHSGYKGLLGWGWGALVATLLINLISHLIASNNANKAIKEINNNAYEPDRIERRNKKVVNINWISVIIMISGIGLIISFIIINTLL